jgi:hypothetical protein
MDIVGLVMGIVLRPRLPQRQLLHRQQAQVRRALPQLTRGRWGSGISVAGRVGQDRRFVWRRMCVRIIVCGIRIVGEGLGGWGGLERGVQFGERGERVFLHFGGLVMIMNE